LDWWLNMAGITSAGFEIKDFDTILTEIEEAQRAEFGADLDVSASSPLGPINAIVAAKLSELWEVLQDTYASQYPNGAYGIPLDQLCQITGVVREDASNSRALCSVTGTPGVVITTNEQIKHNETGSLWYAESSITITSVSSATGYFASVDIGAVTALAGSLDIIETPVAGWLAVTNTADATPGNEVETDASLRVRRKRQLARQGSSTVRAVLADVGALESIESVVVFENYTDIVDDDGLPAHSIEVVVEGGDATEIAQAIFDSKPAGVSAYGTTGTNATDSEGALKYVAFTRPTSVDIYVAISAVTGTGFAGASYIQGALTGYGADLAAGDDVILTRLYSPCYIEGVTDVTDIRISTAASPTATSNITMTRRQRAAFDSADITVTLVDA
jgi:uncharacterized phage protein gp47/JayE